MKKKFLSTLIIGGIICSSSTVVFAKENVESTPHENTKTTSISNKITSKESVDLETSKELSYSIEEMREADSILNNGDLTNRETYNRMLTFASTSLDRIRSLKDENLTEEMNTHIDFLTSIGNEVRIGCNNANELILAIRNLETIVSSPNEHSNEEKENSIYALNDIIVKNAKEESLNKKTLATACNILHKYANVTSNNKEENMKTTEEYSKNSSYNIEQMNYAIEEMKEACRLLDNADLSKLSNYERMIRFSTASLDRSRSLNLNKNSNLLCHLDWIEESGNEIRNITTSLNNLITTLREEKEIFAPYSHATTEEKKITLSKLDVLINKEDIKNHLNKTTLENVKKLLNDYHTILNDKNTTETNAQVDTGVGSDSIAETHLNTTISTESNISIGTDAITETNLNNTATSSTQTDINNKVTTATEADITVGPNCSIKTDLYNTNDMAIGTDDIFDNNNVNINYNKNIEEKSNTNNNIKNSICNNIKTEVISVPVHNKINTTVKTDIIKNKTAVETEVKKANNIIIDTEKKTTNKVTIPVSAVATQTDIAPVSAVATQTDIVPVSAVATQTDIVPVSAVAAETNATTTTENIVKPFQDKTDTNKKDNIKNIKSNKEEEKSSNEPTKESKEKIKNMKKTSCGLLGLGLITTLICALLKKFI